MKIYTILLLLLIVTIALSEAKKGKGKSHRHSGGGRHGDKKIRRGKSGHRYEAPTPHYPPPPPQCPPNQVYDPVSCTCQCPAHINRHCGHGRNFNPNTCACECASAGTCKSPLIFDSHTCSCKCPSNMCEPSNGCPRHFTWCPETCKCLCKRDESYCNEDEYWDEDTCCCYSY